MQIWAFRTSTEGVDICEGAPRNVRRLWGEMTAGNDTGASICYQQFARLTGIKLDLNQAIQISVKAVGDIYDITED